MVPERDVLQIRRLAEDGLTVSAIARLTGHDRKTIQRYRDGAQAKVAAKPSCLEPYQDFLAARLTSGPSVTAKDLFDEIAADGFDRSYQTLVRQLRAHGLRPEAAAVGDTPARRPAPPPGEEIQWGWVELQEPQWGSRAHLLVGVLSFSRRCRAVISDGTTVAHLAEAVHRVLDRLGGTPSAWRADGIVVDDQRFGPTRRTMVRLARHYDAELRPARGAARERRPIADAKRYVVSSWATKTPVTSVGTAQADLDDWAMAVADQRKLGGVTIAALAAQEQLTRLPPVPFAAVIKQPAIVGSDGLVSLEGNRYAVAANHRGERVIVCARVGTLSVEILDESGRRLAKHRRAPLGAGVVAR